jgi:hypothetical protein
MAEDYEDRQKVLKSILKVIRTSQNPVQLWNGVHKYKSQEEYDSILDDIEKSESWRSCRRSKIEDHYSSLRRFLPAWYRTIPLTATVLSSSIPKAHAFMKAHDEESALPTTGCPTDFLEQPWKRLAIRQFGRTGEVVRVVKKPYELGLYQATVQGLKHGTIAIPNANRYAPMVGHLLNRSGFRQSGQFTLEAMRHSAPANALEFGAQSAQ